MLVKQSFEVHQTNKKAQIWKKKKGIETELKRNRESAAGIETELKF